MTLYRRQGSRPPPRKRNEKKTKWLSEETLQITEKIRQANTKCLSEETLQITEKRRQANNKGEKERYPHLNAEFQRTARRDKKAFLSDQC